MPAPGVEPRLDGVRVLVVDDEKDARDVIGHALEERGARITLAENSHDALQILEQGDIDVLLADIAMPGEDGYALVRRLRALPSPLGGIPAVALTAYTDPQSVQAAFAAGFDAHLGKPLEPHVLADALSKVLRLRRQR